MMVFPPRTLCRGLAAAALALMLGGCSGQQAEQAALTHPSETIVFAADNPLPATPSPRMAAGDTLGRAVFTGEQVTLALIVLPPHSPAEFHQALARARQAEQTAAPVASVEPTVE